MKKFPIHKIANNIYGIELYDFNSSKDFALAISQFLLTLNENNKYSHVNLFFNTPNYGINVFYEMDSNNLKLFEEIFEDFKIILEEDINFTFINLIIEPFDNPKGLTVLSIYMPFAKE